MEFNFDDKSLTDPFHSENDLSLEEENSFELYHRNDLGSPRCDSKLLYDNEEDDLKPKDIPNLTQINDFVCFDNNLIDGKILEPLITGNVVSNGNKETPKQVNLINKATTISSNKSNSNSDCNSEFNSNPSIEIKTKTKANSFLGRKTKAERGKGEHSKYKEDNKVRKVKSYYLKFINEKANASLSPGHRKFLKIHPKVNENLNKKYNDELMKTKIEDIYSKNPINGRYSKKGINKDYNAVLVKEIYEKNEEKNVMQILKLTYIQFFDIFRKRYINKFKKDVLAKEIKNGEKEKDAKEYVEQLVKLIFGYEDWFKKKTPRTPRK